MAKETSYTHDPADFEATHGLEADRTDPVRLDAAIDHAVDYRGDITITLHSTSETVEGFVFDRTSARDGRSAAVRLIPKGSDERVSIPCDDIERLVFSGRDTAAGKSFETWVAKYIERKKQGLSANIECESLEESETST